MPRFSVGASLIARSMWYLTLRLTDYLPMKRFLAGIQLCQAHICRMCTKKEKEFLCGPGQAVRLHSFSADLILPVATTPILTKFALCILINAKLEENTAPREKIDS